MAEIGQRFESAGRAAVAHRFELAAFEIGELDEALSGDLPRAELPKEGPSAQLPAMAKEFGGTHPPALVKAAEQHDGAAFAAAFARAAAACNACHAASEHGFIEIPSIPGKSVPDFEPLPPSGSASVTP